MSVIHVVSVSSGKDSDATLLLALARYPKERVRAVICDTGNEHEEVWTHISYLEQRLGIKVDILRADFSAELIAKRMFIARDQRTRRDSSGLKVRWTNKAKRRALAAMRPSGNPFLDLCMWKGRFPSRKVQFCTQELKIALLVQYQQAIVEQGHRVVSWQGVRRDESVSRRNAKIFERLQPRTYAYRPLADWTAVQVFEFIRENGMEPNSLYKQGQSRVGCMPCINSGKKDIGEISYRWPRELERLSMWEKLVGDCSKRGFPTFFSAANKAKDRRVIFKELNIWSRVEWSKTSYGGKQYNLLIDRNAEPGCASSYGLCDKS